DQFVQQFNIPIPAGVPPTANFTVRIGWFDGDTGQEVTRFDENGQFAGSALLLEKVQLTTQPSPLSQSAERPVEIMLNQQVGSWLTLIGLDLPRRTFNQGEQIDFALHWTADAPLVDITVLIELTKGSDVVVLTEGSPAGNRYPFADWLTPAYVLDRQRVVIPADLPAGEWGFRAVAIFESGERVELFEPIEISVEPLDLILDRPSIENELNVVFEDQIELVGYTFRPDSDELELVWHSTSSATGDYVAFVHLQNPNGTCCVWQSDRPLVSSAVRPTSRWVVGEYVIDRYVIEGYVDGLNLVSGLYRPENGIRLLTADQVNQVELR
ncbi:MAG: hypothetical protein AAF902_06695, partial [Chloroflexota bacterium]